MSAGLAFAFRLIVARFVAPSEFGVFALALTTFAIVQVINEFGMAATVIQRSADRFNDEVVDTAFAASSMVSVALFLLNLLLIAPLAAWFYESDRVGLVTAIVGVSFLFTPTVSISRALLFRKRDYRAVTIARISATLLSLIAAGVVLAIYRNVWALVVQVVSAQVFLAAAMQFLGDWRPRFRFARGAFGEMIGYSGLVFATDVFQAISKNLDVFVLGRLLAQSQVGLYSLAFYITDVVRLNLASILNRVMFTQYAALQHDMAAVRFYVLRTMSWNALMILPVMMSLALAGPILMPAILGEAWRGMGPTLQFLALSVMIGAIGGTTSTVFKALGRPGVEFATAVSMTALLIPMLILGVRIGGIGGVAAAVALKAFISVIVRQIVLDRLVGSTLKGVIKATAGSLLAQVPMVSIWFGTMAIVPLEASQRAIVALVLGCLGYGATLLLLRRVDSEAWPAFSKQLPSRFAEHSIGKMKK